MKTAIAVVALLSCASGLRAQALRSPLVPAPWTADLHGPRTAPQDDEGSPLVRHVVIGSVIGAAAGVVISMVWESGLCETNCKRDGVRQALFVGGAVGAVVGFAVYKIKGRGDHPRRPLPPR